MVNIIERDMQESMVSVKGAGDDLQRLGRLWSGSLGLLESLNAKVFEQIKDLDSIEDPVMRSLTEDKGLANTTEYMRALKINAEVARILLDFIPKGGEDDILNQLATDLGII